MAPSPEKLTTKQVAAAVGVSEPTILRWGKLGVLPPHEVHGGGRRGRVGLWPPHTIDQARWVLSRLNTHATFAEIKSALERGEFTPDRLAQGRESSNEE